MAHAPAAAAATRAGPAARAGARIAPSPVADMNARKDYTHASAHARTHARKRARTRKHAKSPRLRARTHERKHAREGPITRAQTCTQERMRTQETRTYALAGTQAHTQARAREHAPKHARRLRLASGASPIRASRPHPR